MNENQNRGGILSLKVDVTKIDKNALFKGNKGTYLDITVLMRPSEDDYGNHGMAVQDIGRERREAGERGAILGNAKWVQAPPDSVTWLDRDSPAPAPAQNNDWPPASPQPAEEDIDDIPF